MVTTKIDLENRRFFGILLDLMLLFQGIEVVIGQWRLLNNVIVNLLDLTLLRKEVGVWRIYLPCCATALMFLLAFCTNGPYCVKFALFDFTFSAVRALPNGALRNEGFQKFDKVLFLLSSLYALFS